MKKFPVPAFLLFAVLLLSACKDNSVPPVPTAKTLVPGSWNSYEVGNSATGFVPGMESLIGMAYCNGLSFTADGKFTNRIYNAGKWRDGGVGAYSFKDDKTITLIYSPNTTDQAKLDLIILKVDQDHLWLQNNFWVNEQNPVPTEYHFERAR